ncbi:hypothetical protein ADIS_4791 [Lunatimonas lonarensis]|uniref:Uncharacterized protein n=1 Tax=Lunatimonas lonarensis TaxID=1232681 RepID=R7ZKZ9_9BACT|nr:hypothetical protein ADIS_4791 [Lunatimonas lonarensis]
MKVTSLPSKASRVDFELYWISQFEILTLILKKVPMNI